MLSKWLKDQVSKSKFTLKYIGEQCGTHPTNIHRYLKGQIVPSPSHLNKFTDIFNLTPKEELEMLKLAFKSNLSAKNKELLDMIRKCSSKISIERKLKYIEENDPAEKFLELLKDEYIAEAIRIFEDIPESNKKALIPLLKKVKSINADKIETILKLL